MPGIHQTWHKYNTKAGVSISLLFSLSPSFHNVPRQSFILGRRIPSLQADREEASATIGIEPIDLCVRAIVCATVTTRDLPMSSLYADRRYRSREIRKDSDSFLPLSSLQDSSAEYPLLFRFIGLLGSAAAACPLLPTV